MRRAVVVALVAACQGGASNEPPKQPAPAPDARAFPETRDARDEMVEPDLPVVPEEPVVEDVGAEDLGAIPAWRAVIDRDFYLARRKQHGVVFGRLAADGWLIDETEGNGALAIRVRFDEGIKVPVAGSRVAIGGAWALDEARHWYWKADAVTALTGEAPAKAAPDPESPPGLVVASGAWPAGAKVRAPDKVKEGEIMLFTVVSLPKQIGDGWGVSDQKWGTLMGYLRLPGEHTSYGGHDLRAADERWTLKKQGTYWVRVGKVRRKDTEPAVIEAVTAPVKP